MTTTESYFNLEELSLHCSKTGAYTGIMECCTFIIILSLNSKELSYKVEFCQLFMCNIL